MLLQDGSIRPLANGLSNVQPAGMSDQPTTTVVQTAAVTSGLYDLPEAARLTGLTVDALRKRASRGKLEQVKGNDGTVRVRLTTADLAAIGREMSSPGPDLSGLAPPVGVELHERAAKAEGEAAVLREALGRVQQQADAFVAAAETRREELTAALVRAATAEGEAKALREALAEARRPPWRRWLRLT